LCKAIAKKGPRFNIWDCTNEARGVGALMTVDKFLEREKVPRTFATTIMQIKKPRNIP
jgi:hypothetical protein